jgi:competence protein ComEC
MRLLKRRLYVIALSLVIAVLPIIYNSPSFVFLLGIPLLLWGILEQRFLFFLLLLSVPLFFLFATFVDKQNETKIQIPSDQETVVGEIASVPKIDGDRLSFEFELTSGEVVALSYRIKNKQQKNDLLNLRYGMRCKLNGEISKPDGRSNFYAFDYQDFLKTKQIFWLFSPNDFPTNRCIERKDNNNFLDQLYFLKQEQIKMIKSSFPNDSAGIVIALVFGDKNELDDEVIEMYQQQGLIHLLAISGLHVGLIVGSIFYLLIRIGLSREWTVIIIILVLPLYILLTGASPSVLRAGTMTILFMLCYRFKIKIHPLDVISIVCILQLLYDPYIIKNIGFQFSYLISFSLIISSNKLLNSFHSPFKLSYTVTMIAQLVSLPLVLWNNYELSIFTILLNIIYIPFISLLILPLSLFSVLLLNVYYPLAQPVVQLLDMLSTVSHEILEWLHLFGFGIIVFGKPNFLIIGLLYCSVLYLFLCWEKQVSLLHPVFCILIILIFQLSLPHLSQDAKITFIDVGQGDSILIELPYRRATYLIDTGGYFKPNLEDWQERKSNFDTGKDVVLPYLKALGIRELSGVILTHEDLDHVGGTPALLDGMKVKSLYYPKIEGAITTLKGIIGVTNRDPPPITLLTKGMNWQIGNAFFKVLNPDFGQYGSDNNYSIVLLVQLYGTRILFTGDLEETGEVDLIKEFKMLNASILKVGHHGSNTSTSPEFLQAVDPDLAVITVGSQNRFGHPSSSVVERLWENNIQVLRTDEMGAIKISINKNGEYRVVKAREEDD